MTDDQRLASALRDHYAEEPETPADLERVTRSLLHEIHDTPQQRHRWWPVRLQVTEAPQASVGGGFGMAFSVTRLVVAAAIVALFGGFLLSGVLSTQRSDDKLPAAIPSPPPVTTDELLAGFVTEEMGPGVVRVLSDGYRELSSTGDVGTGVAVGPDGSVWMGRADWIVRLGEPGAGDGADLVFADAEVAADGSLWRADIESLSSFDGQTWTARATGIHDELRYYSVAIDPDGVAWTMEWHVTCDSIQLESCRHTEPVGFGKDGAAIRLPPWSDVFDGQVHEHVLAVSPDGHIWIVGEVSRDVPGADDRLLRFDGSEWRVVPGPEGFRGGDSVDQSLDIASDGTLWVGYGTDAAAAGNDRIARLDETVWTTFSAADGVRPWGSTHQWIFRSMLHAATDGSVWVNGYGDGASCEGVAHFDGATWTPYLRGICVNDMDVAPDGAVWVVGEGDGTSDSRAGRTDIYVIHHEPVVAGTND